VSNKSVHRPAKRILTIFGLAIIDSIFSPHSQLLRCHRCQCRQKSEQGFRPKVFHPPNRNTQAQSVPSLQHQLANAMRDKPPKQRSQPVTIGRRSLQRRQSYTLLQSCIICRGHADLQRSPPSCLAPATVEAHNILFLQHQYCKELHHHCTLPTTKLRPCCSVLKNFQDFPLHRIFGRMHKALNKDKNKN